MTGVQTCALPILELSFVLGTTLPEGVKVAPNLVFGGDTPLKISYLEIGSDR